jgi:hypothetical protein
VGQRDPLIHCNEAGRRLVVLARAEAAAMAVNGPVIKSVAERRIARDAPGG